MVISIGYVSSFSDDRDVLLRKSMSSADGLDLVKTFLDKMEDLQKKHFRSLAKTIPSRLKSLKIQLLDRNLSVKEKSLLVAKFRYLENMSKLKVIGFNSAKYDLACLISFFLEIMGPDNINVIKNGSSFFCLNYNHLSFRDAMNYSVTIPFFKIIFYYFCFRFFYKLS